VNNNSYITKRAVRIDDVICQHWEPWELDFFIYILATEAIYYTSPLEKEFVLEFTITIMMVNKIK